MDSAADIPCWGMVHHDSSRCGKVQGGENNVCWGKILGYG